METEQFLPLILQLNALREAINSRWQDKIQELAEGAYFNDGVPVLEAAAHDTRAEQVRDGQKQFNALFDQAIADLGKSKNPEHIKQLFKLAVETHNAPALLEGGAKDRKRAEEVAPLEFTFYEITRDDLREWQKLLKEFGILSSKDAFPETFNM